MEKGLTVPKWMKWQKIPQMPPKFSAQFVSTQAQKLGIFEKNPLSLGVRSQ